MAPIVGFWRFMDAVHEMTFPLVSVYLDTPEAEEVKPRPVEGALVADAGPEPGPEPGPIEGAVVANAKPATESAKQSLQSDAVRNKPSRDAHVEQAITNGESSSKMRIRDRGQKEEIRRGNTTALGEEKLAEQVATLKVNTHRLFEDLGGQNRELLQENIKAIRWQDAASMTIKEAKDEAKSRKEEAKAAKKAKIQAAATAKRQLDRSQREVKVSKRNEALVAEEKTRAEAKHREEMSVTEGQIQKLQTELNTEIENGGRSIELTDELSQGNQKMQKELLAKDEELLAKDEKLAAKNTENKVLQDRIDLHDAIIQDIHVEARKDREACNKSSREKIASEKAKQVAERKVNDLEREATTVKVKTDKATKALQTKLDQSSAQETAANTRAAKAEGDAEDLRRELENTELARQNFEEKEGKWAALFASNQAHARHPSQSILTTANNPVPAPKPQIPIIIADEVEVSKPAEKLPKKNRKLLKKPEHQTPTPDPETQGLIKKLEGVIEQWERDWQRAKNEVENWKRNTRRELKQKNQTVLATDRENIRRELDEEKQKSLAAELIVVRGNAKRSLRARLVVKLKSQEQKKLQKLNHRALSERAKGKKAQVEWGFNKRVSPPVEVDRSQLERQIRTQLQSEFQAELSNRKTQLQNDYDINISNFKTQWEVEHPLSQAGLDSKKNGDPENRIEMDEPRASTVARSAEDDMLLASLSRESDETHELFQEIGRIGLPRDSAAYVVLQGLNLAKEAIYNVQCELRNAVPNKNNLLYSAIGVHINEHYIQKLDPTTQGVLIRQANEANRRLEYVQKMLGTNDDVPKDAFLQSLLEGSLAPPQTANGYGNFAAPGTSAFPPTVTGFGNAAAHSTSVLTPVNGSGNAAAPGASGFPLTFNGFGNATAPGTSGFPLTLNDFGNAATPGTSEFPLTFNGFGNAAAPAQDVVNPFEDCHFSSQLPLDSTHSQNEPTSVDSNANRVPPNNGDIHSSAPGFDLNSDDMGFSDYATPNIDIDIDWNAIPGIVQNAMAAESTKQVSEARQQLRKKFKKTFQPLGPQSEGSALPMSVNIDTDGDESSHPATEDLSGVIGLGFVPSRSRQAKNPQGQQRGVAPKGRQLAHQAFARKQDVTASLPSQAQHTKAQQTNLQEQVPASQQVGSLGVPRTGFTLEPNHGFDLTPNTSHLKFGSHLRIQQDPTEYQKPLKFFQIPEETSRTSEQGEGEGPEMSRGGISVDQSKPERLMSPKAEDDVPETPPGCEGWTAEMEKYVKDFLQGVDIEQVEAELYCLFPTTENMAGLTGYLEKMKEGLEAQESDRVPKEQSSEQPAGWTTEMTEFVEGCLCGGNDVKATVKLFRLEVAEAFSIQGLEEHVEKLKNEYVNKNRPDVQQDHMPREPLGWTDEMTTIVQDYLRNGDRNVDLMVQSLEIVEENTLYIEGVYEYVAKLKSDFEAQEQDQTEENRPLEQLSGQPDGWTESLTTLLHLLLQKYEDDAEVVQQIHDCWDSSIYMKDLEQYVAKTRVELKARDEDGMQHD